MIRFTIQRKVFIATFALTAAMALLLVGLMRWNLEQGFSRYVVKAELGHIDWMARNIEDAYARQGSWDFLHEDAGVWDRLRRPSQEPPLGGGNFPPPGGMPGFEGRHPPPPGMPRSRPEFGFPPPSFPAPPNSGQEFEDGPPPGPMALPTDRPFDKPPQCANPYQDRGRRGDVLNIGPRLSIRDAEGKLLVGNPRTDNLAASLPIQYQGKVVGSLNLLPQRTQSVDALNVTFLSTQRRELWLSGMAALLLSLVAAWLLARHLLAPIKALAAGARHIAGGRFSERIPVQRSDELGELAADFNAMAEMLTRTEEYRRQWVSDSSHELRTPIAVLRAEIEALQDGVRLSDEKNLARLHKQVMQMSKLVDDLRMTLDRDGGQTILDLAVLSPLTILRECIEEFSPRYSANRIMLDMSALPVKDHGWRIRGDGDRLHQVFSNLFENTLRYTHPGGCLRLTAAAGSGKLQLQFSDTAPAPPDETLPRLFERFFRAEPSRSRELGGTGLGLAICKSIIEAHGGTIRANNSELGGLSVRIELPLGGGEM